MQLDGSRGMQKNGKPRGCQADWDELHHFRTLLSQSGNSTTEEDILSGCIIIHYHETSKDHLYSPVDLFFPVDIT